MRSENIDAVHRAMLDLSDGGELRASYEQISVKAKTPRRTVARAINELIEQGKVRRVHAKGRGITNLYGVQS